jgi:hypothetical protein
MAAPALKAEMVAVEVGAVLKLRKGHAIVQPDRAALAAEGVERRLLEELRFAAEFLLDSLGRAQIAYLNLQTQSIRIGRLGS